MTNERKDMPSMARRQWLMLAGGTLPLLAGCLGGGDDDSGDDDDEDDDGDNDAPDDDAGDDPGDADDGQTDDPDDGDDGDPDPPAASLTDVHIDEQHDDVTLPLDAETPLAATVTNEADATHQFILEVLIRPHPDHTDDPDPVVTDSLPVPLGAGNSDDLVMAGLTGGLDEGRYEVLVTAGDATDRFPLNVFGTNEVTVEVREHETVSGDRLGGGTVTARADGTTYDTDAVTRGGIATLELPLGETTTYTFELDEPGSGKWPPTTVEATIDDPDPDRIEIIAGHPLRGADSHKFSSYTFDETGEHGSPPRDYFLYGSDMSPALAANVLHHHTYFMAGLVGATGMWQEPTEAPVEEPDHLRHIVPPEFGRDFMEIRDELGGNIPNHQITLDGEDRFFYTNDGRWEWSDTTSGLAWQPGRRAVMRGLDGFLDWADSEQRFYGTDEVRGTPVNVYEVPGQEAYVYVDPETGYVRRYEQVTLHDHWWPLADPHHGEDPPLENSFIVSEYWAHDDLETLDWDVIKERSTDQTAGDLNQPPWEFVDE